MKFEIENEFSKTFENYSIKKKTIYIGRSKECDIAIEAEGISRKHVEITEKPDGSYTIKDLESSNGTFINDEKLEPNTEVDFTFFFPAKLGPGIIVSIVEDDGQDSTSGKAPVDDDATNFLASQGIKTGAPSKASGGTNSNLRIDPIKQRSGTMGSGRTVGTKRPKPEEGPSKKGKKTKKQSKILPKIIIFGGMLYGYWEFYVKEQMAPEPPKTEVNATTQEATPVAAAPVVAKKVFTFPLDKMQVINKDKCFTPEEKALCSHINKVNYADGVFILGNIAYIAFDGVKEYQRLIGLHKILPEEVPQLEILAKRQQGIKYSKVIFIKSNYKIGITTKEEIADYLVGSVITNTGLINAFKENQGINKLAIVVYRKDGAKIQPLAEGLITKENLAKLQTASDENTLKLAMKYALISGYKMDFRYKIWNFFNQPE